MLAKMKSRVNVTNRSVALFGRVCVLARLNPFSGFNAQLTRWETANVHPYGRRDFAVKWELRTVEKRQNWKRMVEGNKNLGRQPKQIGLPKRFIR